VKHIAAVFALAAGLVTPAIHAQSSPTAGQATPTPATPTPAPPTACLDSATLEGLIKALDDAVSGPADKDRTCLRQLLYPNARFAPVSKGREGSFGPHLLTVDDWVTAVAKRGTGVFYERQVKVKTETYGHIAHLWSTYEIRPSPEGKATLRGINSIQAVFDGARWKILEIAWQAETPMEHIPEGYLP
jgi:hypothetical protein